MQGILRYTFSLKTPISAHSSIREVKLVFNLKTVLYINRGRSSMYSALHSPEVISCIDLYPISNQNTNPSATTEI